MLTSVVLARHVYVADTLKYGLGSCSFRNVCRALALRLLAAPYQQHRDPAAKLAALPLAARAGAARRYCTYSCSIYFLKKNSPPGVFKRILW